jgi:hypothetical protein
MSIWDDLILEEHIIQILREVLWDHQHHFGVPYLTPYQIAIEFNKRWPQLVQQIGFPIGGAETKEQASLTQYIAKELSTRIKNKTLTSIEGAFLSNCHITEMKFEGNVKSSMIGQTTVSIFRAIA